MNAKIFIKILVVLIAIITTTAAAAQESMDTIAAQELNEVVVQGSQSDSQG